MLIANGISFLPGKYLFIQSCRHGNDYNIFVA
ncbi:MAG: hypothetical protein ACI9SC_000976, partial [Gammaproteobacteria bacterium]